MLFTILHLILQPAAIIASLVYGLVPIAIVDGVVFLALFAVELMIWDVRPHLPRLRFRPVPGYEQN